MTIKPALKKLLGDLPMTAEVYWSVRQPGQPLNPALSMARLEKLLPEWRAQAEASPLRRQPGRRVLVFSVLRYWVEHAALLGTALAGLGHHVTLATVPYNNWKLPLARFDARRQDLYLSRLLGLTEPVLHPVSFLTQKPASLPPALQEAVHDNAWRDTQYSLQVEDIDPRSDLFSLRLERDTAVASAALAWLQKHRPDVVVTPNGSILEFGAVYQAARLLDIPVVSYEFGEQRQRVWLAHNREVMRQETDDLWAVRCDSSLSEAQLDQVRTLFASRQKASLWENFARRWQGAPSQGGQQVRQTLGLDDRPVVLLATNVIGDSLTLGRQVFSDSMTEWLEKTLLYFARQSKVQFVVRIHPGELITKGPSVADVAQRVLPELPEHIRLVLADDSLNTYDLVEIADLGLVYTTTVGLEMAMGGTPVVAVGKTHYRGKGFTLDADSWEAYYGLLDQVLADPQAFRLTQAQVNLAWNYAYRFFFEYPHPFPWHLLHIWEDLEAWPLKRLFSDEGQASFGQTFRYLAGEPVRW